MKLKGNEMKCLYSPPTLMNHFNFLNIELSYYNIPPQEINFRPNLYSLKEDTFLYRGDSCYNPKIPFHFIFHIRPIDNFFFKLVSTLDPTKISARKKFPP